uniref:Uncharacterized protein n=1 Tax=Ditylenchus dipsaci TaxID=166011 RepID=A0A915EI67_9BILA
MQWLNQPQKFCTSPTGLQMTAEPDTDFWRSHKTSDWSVVSVNQSNTHDSIWLKLLRKDDYVEIKYSFDGQLFQLLRLASFEPAVEVMIGMYGAAPGKLPFDVTFEEFKCRRVGNKGRGKRSVRLRGVPGCANCAVRELLEIDGGYCTPHRAQQGQRRPPPSYEESVRQLQQPLVYRPPDEAITLPLLGNPDQINFHVHDVIEDDRRWRRQRRSSLAPFFKATITFVNDQGMCRGTCRAVADCNKEQTNFKKICTCFNNKCMPIAQRSHVWQLNTDKNGNYILDTGGTCHGPCKSNAECEERARKIERKPESCQCVHGTCRRFIHKRIPLDLATPVEGRSDASNYMAKEVANNLIKEFEMHNYMAKRARDEANKRGDPPETKRFKENRDRFNNRVPLPDFMRSESNQGSCEGECVIDKKRCSKLASSSRSKCECSANFGECVLIADFS